MVHRITLTGSVALMIFMGTLLFAGPAQAAGPCDTLTEGTQAYAQCMVRAEDREAAPILPPVLEQDVAPARGDRLVELEVERLVLLLDLDEGEEREELAEAPHRAHHGPLDSRP